ncbi:hypothetical protein ACOSQ2_005593 [Xanthoceras sorbifolium]
MRTRGFSGRRGDFNQPENAQDKEKNVNGVQVDREKDRSSSRSANVEEAGREDKLVGTVDVDAGKENVVPMPEEEVVGAVTRSRVIFGMVDENVMEGVHVAVMVKADYSDNAGAKERVGGRGDCWNRAAGFLFSYRGAAVAVHNSHPMLVEKGCWVKPGRTRDVTAATIHIMLVILPIAK